MQRKRLSLADSMKHSNSLQPSANGCRTIQLVRLCSKCSPLNEDTNTGIYRKQQNLYGYLFKKIIGTESLVDSIHTVCTKLGYNTLYGVIYLDCGGTFFFLKKMVLKQYIKVTANLLTPQTATKLALTGTQIQITRIRVTTRHRSTLQLLILAILYLHQLCLTHGYRGQPTI